jgi:hypothetical protein
MREVQPPGLALWLLRQCAPRRYRESLTGDVIELRRAGKSAWWCWRQALGALVAMSLDGIRRAPWFAAIKALVLALGILTLGAGTLSWAARGDTCVSACGPIGVR